MSTNTPTLDSISSRGRPPRPSVDEQGWERPAPLVRRANNPDAGSTAGPSRPRGWTWLLNQIARKRALLTSILVLLLLAHAWTTGLRPRDPFNVGDPWAIAGLWTVLLGVSLRAWAAGTLHKATTLTTTGPYALVRHPLYVGSYLMLLGFCLLLANWATFLAVLGPLSVIYVLRLRREERTLAKRFGEAWAAYARSTPRFLPLALAGHAGPPVGYSASLNPSRRGMLATWRLSLWRRNHEHRALTASIVALAALKLWHDATG
jgi:protein-S-isoprenylcysteine O-methyltransferase Ste14